MAVAESKDGVELVPLSGAEDQLWRIDPLADGTYRIVAKVTGHTLSATFRITPGNGDALEIYTAANAQGWLITAP
jgi:hypothetical protein